MWCVKGSILLFWASMHGSLWLLVAWESCKHQRCGWVSPPHKHLQHREVSSLRHVFLEHRGTTPLPWPPGDQQERNLSSSTSLPARTGSGQPGCLLLKMMLLWGGRASWSLSTWDPGIAETWAQSEVTSTRVLSQPETPTQLLPTEQGSCLQKAAPEKVFRQSNTNGIWKPISSQFLPALKHLIFLFTLLVLSKMEVGFLFLWKTERKTKIIRVFKCCQLLQF